MYWFIDFNFSKGTIYASFYIVLPEQPPINWGAKYEICIVVPSAPLRAGLPATAKARTANSFYGLLQ